MKRLTLVFSLYLMTAVTAEATTYSDDVKPILDGNCIECHNGVTQQPDFRSFPFHSTTSSNQQVIVEDMLTMLEANPPKMPPGNRPNLSVSEVAILQTWLDGGLQP